MSDDWVYRGHVLSLKLEKVGDMVYEIIHHVGAVVIVPVTKNNEILFVEQFRKPPNKNILELPAGCIDPDEKPEVTAQRELREETGMRAEHIERMTGFYASPGFCDEYIDLFVAKNLVEDPLIAEDTDKIKVHAIPIDQALKLIRSEKIVDAKTIAGLLFYHHWASDA